MFLKYYLKTFSTKTGYTSQGWSTTGCNATSATHQAGGSYTTNASTTMYAVWKSNTVNLYNNGNENTSVTGGWVSAYTDGNYDVQGEFTKETTRLHLSADCYKCIIYARTKNKINISNYSNLSFTTVQANGSSSYGHNRYFGLCDGSSWNGGTNNMKVSKDMGLDSSVGTYTLNISNQTGSYYICAFASGVWSDVWISKVVLK